MNLTWDFKFLFLVEVGDPYLGIGNLSCVSSFQSHVTSATSRLPLRRGNARQCRIRPSALSRAGIRRVWVHMTREEELECLAPCHAPLLLRVTHLVAPALRGLSR
ncbi:hypothetical protein HAX54_028866, partial [Datura stramonium]|nr:hypothetical protein [Datura stramonium]